MKKLSILIGLMIVAASASWVTAGPFGVGCWDKHGMWTGAEALSSLNLSADQAERIRSLKEALIKEISPIRMQMFQKRVELGLLWMQTTLDPEKIKTVQREMGNLFGQLRDKVTDYRLSVRKLLTPEQVSQLLAKGLWRDRGPRCPQEGARPQCWGRGGF